MLHLSVKIAVAIRLLFDAADDKSSSMATIGAGCSATATDVGIDPGGIPVASLRTTLDKSTLVVVDDEDFVPDEGGSSTEADSTLDTDFVVDFVAAGGTDRKTPAMTVAVVVVEGDTVRDDCSKNL
mmetsp:Transcript_46792/g.114051  ORF Transcript_46792/g.114051 Transcript_46792/m.114051 type:complete len:126 (-) Transcript_46792:1530-1907(-)